MQEDAEEETRNNQMIQHNREESCTTKRGGSNISSEYTAQDAFYDIKQYRSRSLDLLHANNMPEVKVKSKHLKKDFAIQ